MSGSGVRGSSRSGLVALALALALMLPTDARSAQEPAYDGLDVDLDPETLAGFALSVRAHAPLGLTGEAFESLHEGWGGSVALTGYFGERYAGRLRLGFTSFEENIVDVLGVLDDRAWLLDVWAELLWTRAAGRLSIEAGPAIGYARLARPAHAVLPRQMPGGSVQNGFVAGGSVGTTMTLAARWVAFVGGVMSWSSFAAPAWAFPPPPGFPDEGAYGRRIVLELGLAYRWGNRPRPGHVAAPQRR